MSRKKVKSFNDKVYVRRIARKMCKRSWGNSKIKFAWKHRA